MTPLTRRGVDPLDLRLRELFQELHVLPLPLKRLAVGQLSAIANGLSEHGEVGEEGPVAPSASVWGHRRYKGGVRSSIS